MKIRVPLVIEVDPQKWAEINGQIVDEDGNYTTAAVRDDIRTYFLHHVQGAAMVEDTDAVVRLQS